MKIGTVLGPVALEKGVSGAEKLRWVQVRCGGELLTALDPVGVRPGALVLVAEGEGAGRLCPEIPVDAVVLGVAEGGNNG